MLNTIMLLVKIWLFGTQMKISIFTIPLIFNALSVVSHSLSHITHLD